MRAKITTRTKAIVIINPNNPTGALSPREVLQEIVDIAREHRGEGGAGARRAEGDAEDPHEEDRRGPEDSSPTKTAFDCPYLP